MHSLALELAPAYLLQKPDADMCMPIVLALHCPVHASVCMSPDHGPGRLTPDGSGGLGTCLAQGGVGFQTPVSSGAGQELLTNACVPS